MVSRCLGCPSRLGTLPNLAEYRSWLDDFITRALRSLPATTSDRSLILAASVVLDPAREALALSSMHPEVAVAIRAKGLLGSYGRKGAAPGRQ